MPQSVKNSLLSFAEFPEKPVLPGSRKRPRHFTFETAGRIATPTAEIRRVPEPHPDASEELRMSDLSGAELSFSDETEHAIWDPALSPLFSALLPPRKSPFEVISELFDEMVLLDSPVYSPKKGTGLK